MGSIISEKINKHKMPFVLSFSGLILPIIVRSSMVIAIKLFENMEIAYSSIFYVIIWLLIIIFMLVQL